LANNDFKTITTTYHIKEFDETYYSDLLCKKLGVNNIKVYPKLENYYKENILLKINYHQDQPIPGCSHINEYEVFKKAREENIIVMLDGQGADEYLLGYPEFENQYIIDLFKNKNYIKAIQLLRIVSSNRNSSLLKEFKKVLYLIKNNNKYQLGYQNSVENLSLTELLITSIPYQLHSEDRNSMLNSIESRLPFLDYRLVEFILSVDVAHKLHKGQRKSILRDFNPHLPDAIKNRKDKMGFVAPDDIFLQSIPKNKMDEMKSAIQSFAINVDDLNMTRTKFKLVSLYYWMKAFEFVD
jgi:asparagine synthase (glutamine-hydrolysing)